MKTQEQIQVEEPPSQSNPIDEEVTDFSTHDASDTPVFEIIPVEQPEVNLSNSDADKPTHKQTHASTSSGSNVVAPVIIAGAVAATALLARWLWSQRRPRPLRPDQVFLETVDLKPSHDAGRLKGKTMAVSDRLEVVGVATRFGSDTWQSVMSPSTSSAAVIDTLIEAGATLTATVPTEPLGLGPLSIVQKRNTNSDIVSRLNKVPNPAVRGRVHGGGEYGAAVSVAAGLVDVAIAVDELGSALIPAGCCGVFALRSTQGTIPSTGAFIASPSLAAVTLVANTAGSLYQAGQALKLPSRSSGDSLTSYLVAEDLFAVCGETVHRAMPAVVNAVKRWAGADQAQGLSLCEWLYHRFPTLQTFFSTTSTSSSSTSTSNSSTSNTNRSKATNSAATNSTTSSKERVELVLDALYRAAEIIKLYELHQMVGSWSSDSPDAATLPQEVKNTLTQAAAISVEDYSKATNVAQELHEGLRAALQQNVFVIPTLVDPPPKTSENKEALDLYRKRCLQLAAFASLSQAPQLAIPIQQPDGLPASISLLGLHRSDMSLLQAGIKLEPMLNQELGTALNDKDSSSSKANGVHSAAAYFSSGGGKRQQNSKNNKTVDDSMQEHLLLANAAKEAGNAAFKASKYDEAIRQYSEAIRLDPRNAVYYNNRALVHLKMGNLSAAEGDCDSALQLDPNAVKALLRRGSARLARGDMVGAKEDFTRVLVIEPKNKQAVEELGKLKTFEFTTDGF